MVYKLLLSSLLTTTLLTSMDSCFAMDPENYDDPALKGQVPQILLTDEELKELKAKHNQDKIENQRIKNEVEFLQGENANLKKLVQKEELNKKLILIREIRRLEEESENKDGKEKINTYSEILKLIDSYWKQPDDDDMEFYMEFKKILDGKRAYITDFKASALFDFCHDFNKEPQFQRKYLEKSIKLTKRAYLFHKEIGTPSPELFDLKYKMAQRLLNVGWVFNRQAKELANSKEKDFLTILQVHKQALTHAEEGCTLIFSAREQIEEIRKELSNINYKKFHKDIFSSLQMDQLLNQKEDLLELAWNIYNSSILDPISPPTIQLCKMLIKNADLLKMTLSVLKTNFVDSSFKPQWQDLNEKKGKKITKNQGSTQTFEFNIIYQIIYFEYCILNNNISKAFLNLSLNNEVMKNGYKQKSDEYLQCAIKAFADFICPLKYKNNVSFISASLEALVGNEQPLKEFYMKSRVERQKSREKFIATKILSQQEEIKQQQEKSKKIELELRQDTLKTAKQQKKKIVEREVPLLSSSVESIVEPNSEKIAIKETVKKEKIKTRKTVNPSYTQQQSSPKKPIKQVKEIVEINLQTHLIPPKNHKVFLALIGESAERNISLKQVKTLLGSLNCHITTGKGSHNKATAPNGEIWTIPSEWEGPIPPYYRLQLMHFLLDDMELNPNDVKPSKI